MQALKALLPLTFVIVGVSYATTATAQVWSGEHKFGGVYCIAFSPDGSLVATGSYHDERIEPLAVDEKIRKDASPEFANLMRMRGGEAKIWDAATGELKATLRGHFDCIKSAAFSPDGQTLATGNGMTYRIPPDTRRGDCVIKLWNVNTGKEQATLAGSPERITSIAFSADGESLASASWDGTVIVWDVKKREQRIGFDLRHDRLKEIAMLPDGKTLAAGSWEGGITFWNIHNGTKVADLHLSLACNSVAISSNGKYLAGFLYNKKDPARFYEDSRVQVWEIVKAGKLDGAVVTYEKTIIETKTVDGYIAFSPNARLLALVSIDQDESSSVKLFDPMTGKKLAEVQAHPIRVGVVAFSPDGKRLATGGRGDRTVKLWDVTAILENNF